MFPIRSRRLPEHRFRSHIRFENVSSNVMTAQSAGRTLFFFEKPSAMRQLQRFFKSPNTVCVAAEGHLLKAEEPGSIRPEWKTWRFEALPIVVESIPVGYGANRSGQ